MPESAGRLLAARRRVIRRYLRCLERADAGGAVRLFAPEGEVTSPLYGRMPAVEFYPLLFAVTARSRIAPRHVLASLDAPDTLAADFDYEWTLADGSAAAFRCVDVFTFGPGAKVRHLAIIYDTARVPGRSGQLRPQVEGR